MSESDARQLQRERKLDALIDEFDTAMLVTASLHDELRARPMMIAEHRGAGNLVFATRAEDGKLEEILASPGVAVTMQTEGRYLSISGEAVIERDETKRDELWSPSWKLWFPEGQNDPQLCLIRVKPHRAEYWDRSGIHRLEFLWKSGRAFLRGEKAPDDELNGHDKLDFR